MGTMSRGMRTLGVALWLTAGLAAAQPPPPEPGTSVAEIGVTVNGETVLFAGQGPVQAPDGTVLVPLRGIFEKMGAGVQWNAETKTVVAVRGTTTVTLRLGESVGYVNNAPRPLSSPAQAISGATLVPLRFLSESFGAQVKWDPVNRVVSIQVQASPADGSGIPAAAPPPAARPEMVQGTLSLVAAAERTLTVRTADGSEEKVLLSPDAVVLVKAGDSAATEQEVGALRVGDPVQIRLGPDGRAVLVKATYGERIAVLRAVEPLASGKGAFLAFAEGLAVEAAGDALVMREGREAALTDLKPGDRVKLRLHPTTMRAVAIEVVSVEAPQPVKAEIQKVVHDVPAGRWVRAGETILFTVTGTAGAKGTLRVPGLTGAESLPLTESAAAGVYTAALTVPAGVFLREAAALATLTLGTSISPNVAAAETFGIDSVGPVLGSVLPVEGAMLADLRPQFTGTYADTGSGIASRRMQLLVGGADVSADAVFTDSFFSYKPTADLKPGPVASVLIVRDVAGNETRREWRFTILPVEIVRRITVLPGDRALDYGDILTVKVEGVPGAAASFSLGRVARNVPMKEDTPGVYLATHTVQRDDMIVGGTVMVSFTPPSGKTITRAASGTVTITAGAPDAPVIDLPQEGASVGGSVTLSGRTLPNAQVRVTVRYQGRRLVVSAGGLVATVETKADARGNWVTPPIVLKTPREVSGVSFVAEVVAVSSGGASSAPSTVKFRK